MEESRYAFYVKLCHKLDVTGKEQPWLLFVGITIVFLFLSLPASCA